MPRKRHLVCILQIAVVICLEVLCVQAQATRKALPKEAGQAICSLTKTLKEVSPWTREKIASLKSKHEEYEEKLIEWNLQSLQSPQCYQETLLKKARDAFQNASDKLSELSEKAIHSGALAANSAGRIDEFIMVFTRAKGGDNGKYCLEHEATAVQTTKELHGCFSPTTDNTNNVNEESLFGIPDKTTEKAYLNLEEEIGNIGHEKLGTHFTKGNGNDGSCNLIKGSSGGILSKETSEKVWWGGGILTIGKGFDGEMKGENFTAGEIEDIKGENKALWTKNPAQSIPHLKGTSETFKHFTIAAKIIEEKLSEIEKIEQKVQICLRNNMPQKEKAAPSCFDKSAKLEEELIKAKALLEIYKKVKGISTSHAQENVNETTSETLNTIAKAKDNMGNRAHIWYILIAILP